MEDSHQKPNEAPATCSLEKLAFLTLVEVDKGVFRGGVLVTDAHGKPLEFRCTSSIQPTPVQRTLYGNTLRAHLAAELTGRPLLAAIHDHYDAVLTDGEEFSELRRELSRPLLLLSQQGASVAVDTSTESDTGRELLTNIAGKFAPIIVTVHSEYQDDMVKARVHLNKLFCVFDLMEPFARINNAIKFLHEKGAATGS
jgi:hypothetical protein